MLNSDGCGKWAPPSPLEEDEQVVLVQHAYVVKQFIKQYKLTHKGNNGGKELHITW